MTPPAAQGVAADLAAAARGAAKVSQKSPRFAIVTWALVAALGLVLAFVWAWNKTPSLDEEGRARTTGDWMRTEDFRKALAAELQTALAIRDATVGPATDRALGELRRSIEAVGAAQAKAADAVDARLGRLEQRIDLVVLAVRPPAGGGR